jgi:hypothetical protein
VYLQHNISEFKLFEVSIVTVCIVSRCEFLRNISSVLVVISPYA